ncbi:CUB domain-containing protein 2-like [Ambystoma mexicanum]|uniref:CUB domain-containing protein 2-like n=1 Tax=Ambystoma mexicanum TaxID=8296 RepID=UPI0037E9A2B6
MNPINFSPSYKTVKCGGTLTSPSGSFSSPEYPSAYPNYLDCTWVMLAPVGNQILFSVDFFEVEGHLMCNYDYLMIYNGGSSNSPLIGKYCGFVNIAPYTSTGNALRIVFNSDLNNQFSGFVARYSFVSAS